MSFIARAQLQNGFHRISCPVQYEGKWISPFISTPNDPNSSDYIKITNHDESNIIGTRCFKILDLNNFTDPIDMEEQTQSNDPVKEIVVLSCCNTVFKISTVQSYILNQASHQCPHCKRYNFNPIILNTPTFKTSCVNDHFVHILIVAGVITSVALIILYVKFVG